MASNLYGNRDEWKTFTDWILEDSHDVNNLYKIKLTANIEILKTLLNSHSSYQIDYYLFKCLNYIKLFWIFTYILNVSINILF